MQSIFSLSTVIAAIAALSASDYDWRMVTADAKAGTITMIDQGEIAKLTGNVRVAGVLVVASQKAVMDYDVEPATFTTSRYDCAGNRSQYIEASYFDKSGDIVDYDSTKMEWQAIEPGSGDALVAAVVCGRRQQGTGNRIASGVEVPVSQGRQYLHDKFGL